MFLLIDKPEDWTSHDVVAYLRGALKIKKVGHAGTLDPFATGLLIVAVEREYTKRLDEFKAMKKEYIATIQLGATSNTQDKTGTIATYQPENIKNLDKQKIEQVLQTFIGKQEQIPPMFSAKKVKGKKLYELARKGIEIERKPSNIEIFGITLNNFDQKTGQLNITCTVSTGTYIRTLAHDIGEKLNTGAYCKELRRTKIGEYSVENAKKPKEIQA